MGNPECVTCRSFVENRINHVVLWTFRIYNTLAFFDMFRCEIQNLPKRCKKYRIHDSEKNSTT